jgi:Protein of unknown function (DUF2459)
MSSPTRNDVRSIVGRCWARACVGIRSFCESQCVRGARYRFSRHLLPLAVIVITACAEVRPGHPAPVALTVRPGAASVIYVTRRGWHIDVGFAAGDLMPPLRALTTEFPGVQYLVFGFGDRHYLTAQDHHGSEMLAALWPGPALILATGLKASPAEAFGSGSVLALPVSAEQLQSAQAFVWQSLSEQAQESGSESAGPYAGSRYYGASANYSALHTCNTWAAQAIRATGWPVRSRGVIFAGQLWHQLQHLLRADQNTASAAAAMAP